MYGEHHISNVARAIEKCRNMAPNHMSSEAVKNFNQIVNCILDINKEARDALRDYLFCGGQNTDKDIGDEYVQLVSIL